MVGVAVESSGCFNTWISLNLNCCYSPSVDTVLVNSRAVLQAQTRAKNKVHRSASGPFGCDISAVCDLKALTLGKHCRSNET